MSRTDKLWRSSLLIVPLALFAGCNQGGSLDPLDNFGASSNTPPPTSVNTVLPDCSATTAAPCKIALSDLSFTEDANCAAYTDEGPLGMTWNNPGGDKTHLQFGASETSTLDNCQSYQRKQCDMTLSAVPALFNTVQASKIRLTFTDKHKLAYTLGGTGTTISTVGVATGTLRFGNKDALIIGGTLNDGSSSLDATMVSSWLTAGADRTLGLRIKTDCGQVFMNNLPVFWSVESVIAEMLP